VRNSQYYWLVEEYRVSLFAQELKTLFPISRKKLAQKMHEIDLLKLQVFTNISQMSTTDQKAQGSTTAPC
jgi:hypothetical protein